MFLAALTLTLFSPAFTYDFLNYDDDLYVYENAAVQRGLSGSAALSYAFTSTDAGTWAPLTWLSYMADTTLMGGRASSYHTTNVLLHTAAGMILFFALQALLKSFWSSLVIAAIFLVHPLRTESVVWIAERKDVLFALFWALGLLAYQRYASKPSAARYALVFLCFVCGLMSKFMMVTFPFLLLLLDFWPLNRTGGDWRSLRGKLWPLFREKIPFFLACALFTRLTARALNTTGTLNSVWSGGGAKLLRVLENYVFYIGKIFWPGGLSAIYPIIAVEIWPAILCGALLLAVTVIAIRQMWKMPWLLVGWFWFLGTFVPVIGFVTFGHFFVADRYTYIPSIGLTLAIVVGIEQFSKRFLSGQKIAIALAAVALAGCALATLNDLPRWKNSLALYDAALRVGPHQVTYNNRGTFLVSAGEHAAALDDFTKAIRFRPDYAKAFCNRAHCLIMIGNFDAAIADCSKALELDPTLADAFSNRGNALARKGQPEKALDDYAHAIKLNPNRPAYYNNRAAAFYELKQFDKALADLKTCEQLGSKPHPGLVQALADALREKR